MKVGGGRKGRERERDEQERRARQREREREICERKGRKAKMEIGQKSGTDERKKRMSEKEGCVRARDERESG